jgi:lipopolysaccharide export system protein LptA
VEGDSITITSRHLEYDGNTKKAKLRNNVVFTKLATAKLYTDFLDYDRMVNEAKYFNGGRLVDSINTLVSRKGYYDATSNLASFKRNVKVTNPDYTMDSDSLQYNSRTKIIYFVTETSVTHKDSSTFIYKSGQYNTITRTSDLSEGAGQTLNYDIVGKSYDIDDFRKIYKVRGDVIMTSKE